MGASGAAELPDQLKCACYASVWPIRMFHRADKQQRLGLIKGWTLCATNETWPI